MIDTLIVHGSYGSPNANWFPWLGKELTEQGKRVIIPHFPDRELQNLDNWSNVLSAYDDFLSKELVIYAHSLGPAFVVDYFVKRRRSLKKAVFVVPFYDLISIEEFDQVNKTFFVDNSYIGEFSGLCDSVHCIYSDDDPYVPRDLSESFASLAKSATHVIEGGKHLNTSSGYSEFPLLLEF